MTAALPSTLASAVHPLVAVAGDTVTDGPFSVTAVVLGIVLLVANGAFVAAEISLLAARRTRIEEAADAGDPRARRALRALRELSVTFSGAQLGITMCSLGLGAVAEPAVAALFAGWLGASPLPAGAVPAVAFALALSLVVFLHMVVGEMAPKNLALARAEAVALALARPFGWFLTLLRPLIVVLNGLANALVRLVRVEPIDERGLVQTPAELALALAESHELGTIAPQDARVMAAALRLAVIDAEDAMTPRVDIAALSDDATLEEALDLARATGHTRLPVYRGDIDRVVGLVNIKDVLVRGADELRVPVRTILRPIPAVPESRDLEQLLGDMIGASDHAVVVVDEFGSTAGLLTLEDVLEELVGEIADEFDEVADLHLADERVWRVPGTQRRDELERLTGLRLEGGTAETVSGWLVEQLGRLLEPGDAVATPGGWDLRVVALEGRRAGEVEVRAPLEGAAGADGPPDAGGSSSAGGRAGG